MNQETYEALKRIIEEVKMLWQYDDRYLATPDDVKAVSNWIDAVAGYYQPGGECYEGDK